MCLIPSWLHHEKKSVISAILLSSSVLSLFFQQIFTRMSPYTLGRAACVCRKWKYTARNPTLWRAACLKTWQVSVFDFVIQFHVLMFSSIQFYVVKRSGMEANYMMVRSLYDSSWRRMWLQRPRIRIDGKYSRSLISYNVFPPFQTI
jgi:hypothetical protein